MDQGNGSILALDVGAARIGLALASAAARFATPAGALANDALVMDNLHAFCMSNNVLRVVIGLPRGMAGQDTEQTAYVREFGKRVVQELDVPISWQDEAVTSVQAEAELRERNKPYSKGDIDALAATYILEDFLRENI